jgi:hypothetical protein
MYQGHDREELGKPLRDHAVEPYVEVVEQLFEYVVRFLCRERVDSMRKMGASLMN